MLQICVCRGHGVKYFGASAHIRRLHSFPGGEPEAPTDLVTSEVTHRSFRATWTAPGGPVDMYRLTYATVAGGPTEQVR